MRILHLDAGYEMRGGQWQALRLLEGLAGSGTESTLLARRNTPLFETARQRGLRVEPLGLARAAKLARQHDLVHAHDARSHTIAAVVGGGPLVVARRVAFPIGGAEFRANGSPAGLGQRASAWKYGRAERYIAVSEFVRSVLRAGGVAEERISVIYDSVPVFPLAARENMKSAWPARVLAPANLADPRKGASLAIEASDRAGAPVRLSADLERDLPGATLFLYITHCEGLGSAALLAMSAGVPVIASDTGGLREAIRHRENGILVENTPEAIAAAIRELLDNRDFAARIAANGRQTVLDRFTVERMVRRTIDVYRQVLA
jgi:glycosyltransferase involved in cell wall biosynthesis